MPRAKRISIFECLNTLIMLCISVAILYPFLYVLKQSFLDSNVSNTISLGLIPDSFTLNSYKRVLTNQWIGYGFVNTVTRVLTAAPLTLVVMLLAAYPLSKPYFPHRSFWTGLLVFTMFFDGGLIPTYLVVKGLGLVDTMGALLLPKLIDTFSLIIVRNYYMSIPPALEESARIDGAGDLRILVAIILPVSLPIIATVALWTIVNHWSWYFDSMIYMLDAKKHVLQVVLRRIVLEGTTQMMDLGGFSDATSVNPDTVKAAAIMVTTIPIVCVYPFMQKYFIKGIMVGSLKG